MMNNILWIIQSYKLKFAIVCPLSYNDKEITLKIRIFILLSLLHN